MGFFGGRPGKDFQIKKIFSNTVELKEDLNNIIGSPVELGDIVLISYGIDENSYNQNYETDKTNFNSSFWQKIYIKDPNELTDEDIVIFLNEEEKVGLAYKFLFSAIGEKGDTGEQGIQGIQGEKGDTGEQGIQGIQGEKGDALNIIGQAVISGTAEQDTIDLVVPQIIEKNPSYEYIAANELIAVNYKITDNVKINSYWYFNTRKTGTFSDWGRVLITEIISSDVPTKSEIWTFVADDGTEIKREVFISITSPQVWTFVLDDGTEIEKEVYSL